MKEELKIPEKLDGWSNELRQPVRLISSHRHDELEVNLVLNGRAAYLFGRERVPLVTGSMIWLFPEQEHVLMDCSHDFTMWVVVFRQRLVRRCSSHIERAILRRKDPGEILCRQIDARRASRLNHIYDDATVAESADHELVNSALAYALIASWKEFQFSRESIPRTDVHPAVARAAQIIARADSPLNLPDLAKQSGLSDARLSRLFKAQTGVSLTVFRQRKCVERFLHIFRSGKRYSITEAALQAGFGSYPQFHRVFCNIMGQTPSQYRRSLITP